MCAKVHEVQNAQQDAFLVLLNLDCQSNLCETCSSCPGGVIIPSLGGTAVICGVFCCMWAPLIVLLACLMLPGRKVAWAHH